MPLFLKDGDNNDDIDSDYDDDYDYDFDDHHAFGMEKIANPCHSS